MEYKDSLNLPKTGFKMKANLPNNEPKKLDYWNENQIYRKLIEKNKDNEKFIFHDGPPYANGDIHYGHILNKILKDFVIKYKNMQGYKTEVINGWDCHGLPIELQVDKKLKNKKREMTKQELIKEYREYASNQVANQKEQFKRLGVFSDWNVIYRTMDYQYEAQIVREFGKIAKKGALYKGKKPVHWCSSCVTALAEAEIEYDEHTSFSIYVKFKLNYDFGIDELKGKDIFVVIWTTTPWTIPANMGISLHPKFDYSVIEANGEYLVMATDLIEAVKKENNIKEHRVIHSFKGSLLDKETCDHPFIDRKSLIMNGDHVTLDAGTGCVHTAPGHGMEDYIIGQKYGLEVFNPVDDYGRYTDDFPLMKGVKISTADCKIEDLLVECHALLNQPGKRVKHSYPHCWRCGNPTIFRATDQWFIPMDSDFNLRQKALQEIKKVEWIPEWGADRINGMIENRPDWCISRQRTWGMPIPVFFCNDCGQEVIDQEIIERVATAVEERGVEAWHDTEATTFLGADYCCQKCGNANFRKERDILDVWFDSGVSYSAVMEQMQGEVLPIDLYLEGSDQHRGWFHSSLLTSMITRGKAPYKKVLTHGFVMDQNGKKLSKKLKNYESPQKFINVNGVETLRLWVAAEDYRNDSRFGEMIIKRIKESYRKFRNTARYGLSNLYDFNPDQDMIPLEEMHPLDQWAMGRLNRFIDRVLKGYEAYEFHMIYYYLNELCSADLSAFYFSIIKDTLYAEGANSKRRRSIQSVLFHIVHAMAKLLAPILSFTAEEIYQSIPPFKEKKVSVFLERFPEVLKSDLFEKREEQFEPLIALKDEVQKELEKARKEKLIGQNLDAKIILDGVDDSLFEVLEGAEPLFKNLNHELALFLIVSQVVRKKEDQMIQTEIDGVSVKIEKASGGKCPRCWTYHDDVLSEEDTCPRCSSVLKTFA